MADVVVMPQLGNTVESCLVTAWHVGVGDTIDANTVVASIETDKSSMEIPTGVAGTVLALLAAEGDEVEVKAPFIIVGLPGEDVSSLTGAAPDVAFPAADTPSPAPVAAGIPIEGAGTPNIAGSPSSQGAGLTSPLSPRARRLADEKGIDAARLVGTGPHGRVTTIDVQAAIAGKGTYLSAPAQATTVQLTSCLGVAPQGYTQAAGALAQVTGSGLGGRLTRADIARLGATPPVTPAAAPLAPVSSAPLAPSIPDWQGPYKQTPLKGIRKLVAERMISSLATHAQLTFNTSAPAIGLLNARARFKGTPDMAGITIGDLVAYAAIQVAAKHPSINATLTDKVLTTFEQVHLGLAVDTPRGLLVPTVQGASALGIKEFSDKSKDLAAQAKAGNINPDLLAGATFTVTNLGSFGIESFTPILNSPQVAILGVDAITPRAVLNEDGSVGVEQRISFSLTVDHAVVDGADAARYLKDLVAYITTIETEVA